MNKSLVKDTKIHMNIVTNCMDILSNLHMFSPKVAYRTIMFRTVTFKIRVSFINKGCLQIVALIFKKWYLFSGPSMIGTCYNYKQLE